MRYISRHSEYGLTLISGRTYIEHGKTITEEGKHIHFHNGEYSTTDKKEIAFLAKHPNLGINFFVIKEDPIDKLAVARKQLKSDDKRINVR